MVDEEGGTHTARAVVLGVGPLHRPKVPEIEGRDSFRGTSFHSAEWDHDYDLAGKRVAVVGTGASAIQFIPEIAPEVEQLHVLQRTPPWIVPKPDREFSEFEKSLFDAVPPLQWLYRALNYALYEARGVGFVSEPMLMKGLEWYADHYRKQCFDDPELRRKVTPDYTMGCKRILQSDTYYPALARDNVELIDDPLGHIEADAIVTEGGERREVDAIIYATGFHVTDYLAEFEVTGLDGRGLNDEWQNGAEAHLGITVSGSPNLFMLLGPNTGLGHNSVLFMIECQIEYVRQSLELLESREASWMDVRPAVHREFVEGVHERMMQTVWQSGCESWYLDESGRNTTLWPGYTFEYWWRTRSPDPDDFRMVWGERAA